ncbi:MAG TPA: hypothetical protein VND99_04100 [Candidatus Acidoferrales bacterium]|nr:hypothetical protein [Candidatus Acidoferrales bacterium]
MSAEWRVTRPENVDPRIKEARVEAQLNEFASNRRALATSRGLKAWGFGTALAGGAVVLAATALLPFVPAAAVTYVAASAAVGSFAWPLGLLVMGFGKAKESVNGFTRNKLAKA